MPSREKRADEAHLPVDANSMPIQVLEPDESNVAVLTAGAATSSDALPGASTETANVYEIASASDIHIQFGASGVTAATGTSRFFPKGVSVYKLDPSVTHVAVIQASGSAGGPVTVGRMI